MADILQPNIVQILPSIKSRRRKRPSCSPTKTPTAPPEPRSQSETLKPKPGLGENIATASLEFENFTFWGEDGIWMKNPTREEQKALLAYLWEKFGMIELQRSLPFLILWCRDGIPAQNERPFSIGGCVAVWLDKDEPPPAEIPIGDMGAIQDDLVMDRETISGLRAFEIPTMRTLRRVSKYFPGCIFVTYITCNLIIEFEKKDDEAWFEFLGTLSVGISDVNGGGGVPIWYHNGPLVATELKQGIKPQPRYVNGDEDDTDYTKSDGCFYPGVMLKGNSGDQISAGIAIQKGAETRVTVPFHCWNSENEQTPQKLGDPDCFKVTQGESHVGNLTEYIDNTDIGLMKVKDGIAFNNRLLDLNTVPKRLVPAAELNLNEEYAIDSFVTGTQRLRLAGIRARNDDAVSALKGKPEDVPDDGYHLSFAQGIYATGAPEIYNVPRIRDGVSGCAVVRVTRGKIASERENVLHEGEICGFMHGSNIQFKYGSGGLLCFADAVDDLVAEGWEVCKVAEKRVADDGDQKGESLSKKRK